MSICKSNIQMEKPEKEMSNAQNKCCFKISVNVPDDIASDESGGYMMTAMNNMVICDNLKLSESTCSESGSYESIARVIAPRQGLKTSLIA